MDETDVEQVTLALLDAATDKDSEVQEQVRKSILTLGKQQPDRVLAMCQDYLLKHPKLVVSHRVVILRTIELIVSCRIEEISPSRIKSIISLASDEMTRSKEVIPDWQQAASNILVAVGNKHINDIMEEILSKFQPGVLPHFFVVQTLANLSDSNVYGMVPFLNAILGTMLPMLSMAKQDNIKWVFSSGKNHLTCFPVVSSILTEQTKQKVQLHDVRVFALPALYSHTAFLFPVLLFFLSLQLCLISATVSWSTWPT